MKALKKHGANATNETTLHLHCTYIFIFFLLLPSPPVCIEDHRQTQILSLINYTQILSLINYTRKHRIRKIAVLRGQDFLRVGWEESNLQWTSIFCLLCTSRIEGSSTIALLHAVKLFDFLTSSTISASYAFFPVEPLNLL